MNSSNIEKLLSQILMVLGGTNAMGVPNRALISGTSIGHAYTEYQRNEYRKSITSPMSKAILNMGGAQIYENTLRMLGYTTEAARAKATSSTDTSAILARQLGGMWVDQQAGNDIRFFANQTYEAMHKWHNRPTAETKESYGAAAAAIFRGVSSGELGAYSLGEAYRFGGELVGTGKYNNTDPTKRAQKIKQDLKNYSKGITDLKDALNVSLEEVLQSFESLTGTKASVMSASRFNSLSRAIYQTTVYGGASNELLASAIATQNAYFQGTGTTQAHAVAAGSFTAHLLAKGVNVEGASADGMEDAMKRQNRVWLTSGRTRELSAAYAHYAEIHGLEQNADTFKQFVGSIGGNATSAAVRKYLTDNDVSGSYINSEHVRRTMGQAEITEGLAKADFDKYKQAHQDLVESNDNLLDLATEQKLLTSDDIALDLVGLRDKVKERSLTISKNNKVIGNILRARGKESLADLSQDEQDRIKEIARNTRFDQLSETDQQIVRMLAAKDADKVEEQRRSILQLIMPGTSVENVQALMHNIGSTLQDRNTYQSIPIDTYRKELAGVQSIKGMAGVFTKMIQKDNGVATVGKILSGFYGVTMNPELEEKLQEIQKIKDPKEQQEALDTLLRTDIAPGPDGEAKLIAEGQRRAKSYTAQEMEIRERIDNSNLSEYEKTIAHGNISRIKKSAKDLNSHTTWLGKTVMGAVEEMDMDMAFDDLVKKKVMTKDEAWEYKQQLTDSNWGLLKDQDKKMIVQARQAATELGYADDDASKVASLVKTVKSTALGTEENAKARKELQKKIENSDSFKDSTEGAADDLKKAKAAQMASQMLGESYKGMNSESMLSRIMLDVSRIANK